MSRLIKGLRKLGLDDGKVADFMLWIGGGGD